MKKIFVHGEKPFNEYIRRIGEKDAAHIVLAGNFDGIGTSKQVLRQVSHEAATMCVHDSDELTSVHRLKKEMENQTKNKKVKGFIQLIASSPTFIFYWSEEGVRLWHDLSQKDVAVIDATGNVVRSWEEKKKFLYYEVCIRNPVEGESPIPIMGMLSTVHTATVIRFWIAEFRRCEKLLFGHQRVAIPRQINMDRAMAFIMAILAEFNHESVKEFLDRCWRIVTGKALDNDIDHKMTPHACASHVMKDVKKLCKKHYAGNMEYGLYSFSTLLNAHTLEEAEGALFDLAVILQGKQLTPEVKEASERMHKRIKGLSEQNKVAVKDDLYRSTIDFSVDEATSTINQTEEEFLHHAEGTCFSLWAKRTIERARQSIKQGTTLDECNGRYSPRFLETIQKLLLPTLPLWSGVMLGDLRRYGSSAPYQRYSFTSAVRTPSKTTSVQEGRFNQLKTTILHGKSRNRVDVFSKKLQETTKALQTLALKDAIKKKTKRAKGRKTILVEESWDKRRREPDQIRDQKHGKYQQSPTKTIPVTKPTRTKCSDEREIQSKGKSHRRHEEQEIPLKKKNVHEVQDNSSRLTK